MGVVLCAHSVCGEPRIQHNTSGEVDVPKFFRVGAGVFNTFAAGLIQAVRKKQLFRTWLCG